MQPIASFAKMCSEYYKQHGMYIKVTRICVEIKLQSLTDVGNFDTFAIA